MMTEIIKYIPQHAYLLFERQIQETDFYLSSSSHWEDCARQWETAGPAFTLLIDGKVEACGGIIMIDETFGECWVFIPFVNRGTVVYRNILRKFEELIEDHKFRRLQSLVVEGFENAEKLIDRLGFVYEGTMKKFGANGENMKLYAKVM